jgi:hypothetical protein
MQLLLILLGLALLSSGIKGTERALGNQLQADFLGEGDKSGGFVSWLAALLAIGALGYIPVLQKPSRALLGLIGVSIFLTNHGIISQLFTSVATIRQQGVAGNVPIVTGAAGGGSLTSGASAGPNVGSSSGSNVGQAVGAVSQGVGILSGLTSLLGFVGL